MFAKSDEIPVQAIKKKQNVVDKELQRAITLTELAPSPYFSIINVYLVDINVFAKFYEIPSSPFQDIEQVAQRTTIAHLSPMCQGQISFKQASKQTSLSHYNSLEYFSNTQGPLIPQ